MSISEEIWTKAETNMARRERGRLIRKKIITFRTFPNVMVKTRDGNWKFPSLKASRQ